MTDSPFDGTRDGTQRGGILRLALPVAMVVLATAFAWYFSQEGESAAADAEDHSAHQHGAVGGSDGMGEMFTLDSAAARRIGVTYASVVRGPVTRTVRVPARVRLDETRRTVIAPRVEGWVEEVFVASDGEAVRAGDPLFSLYSPMLVAAQEELLLARRLAGAGIADSTGTTAELLRTARRKLAFWEVPEAEIDALLADGTLRRALIFRAPHDGVVLRKVVVAGEPLMPGSVALEVADLSRVWIDGALPEQDVGAARIGATAAIEPLAGPADTFTGRVVFIAPVVDEATRTIAVRIAAANPAGALRPGGLATLRLESRSEASALHVPRSAVLVSGTRSIVFVLMPDGMLEPREVRLGLATEDRQVILDGLAAQDVVVASAAFLVDAESNLRTALGAMAAMPGMNMSGMSPPAAPAPAAMPPEHDHED